MKGNTENVRNRFGDNISWEEHLDMILLKGRKKLFHKFSSDNEMVRRISKYMEDTKGKKLIDCGCHVGRWIEFFENMGFEYTGIEQSTKVIEAAKKYHPEGEKNRRFFNNFLWDINFNEEFDIAISIAVLQHNTLEEKKRIIPKIYKALKKGGLFVVFESTILGMTYTQLSHSGWVTLMEMHGFELLESWHKNVLGVEDHYLFRKK